MINQRFLVIFRTPGTLKDVLDLQLSLMSDCHTPLSPKYFQTFRFEKKPLEEGFEASAWLFLQWPLFKLTFENEVLGTKL